MTTRQSRKTNPPAQRRSNTTTDHAVIKRWAEVRGSGQPREKVAAAPILECYA